MGRAFVCGARVGDSVASRPSRMRLYDFLPSGNGYKVRLALRWLGIPFEYREVDIVKGESRTPAFLGKNPFGQVPVLELDDGTCLSAANFGLFDRAYLCLTLSTNPWGGPTSYYGFSRPEDERRTLGPLGRQLREAAQARPAL